ncbi:cytoplasmic protein, partial [candidate division KSB1 bacterium]|nr:cytoplasmic protein [candidate division KSB1 bacterium]
MDRMNRREFIKRGLASGAAFAFLPGLPRIISAGQSPDLVVVSNGTPAELVRNAIEALGGMSRFVQPGQMVLLKPNIAWDRVPEQAANTNPEAVA